jgi:periplasmic divalent cation tolerance protein
MDTDHQKAGGTGKPVPPVSMMIVLCTFPNEEKAAQVGREIVSEGLAACVNIIPGVRSVYRWESKVCDEVEVLAIFKLRADGFGDLEGAILARHPYDTPEIVALDVDQVEERYLSWVVAG